MRSFVERVQRDLVARGNCLDEPCPVRLRYARLGLVGIQDLAQRAARAFRLTRLFLMMHRRHGGDFAINKNHQSIDGRRGCAVAWSATPTRDWRSSRMMSTTCSRSASGKRRLPSVNIAKA